MIRRHRRFAPPKPPNARLHARIAELERALSAARVRATAHARAAAEAREEIGRLTAQLDTIFANIPSGLVLFDEQLRFVRINPVLASVDGRPAAAYRGEAPEDVQPKFARAIEPILRQVLTSGAPITGLALRGMTSVRPADARDWEASFYPIRRSDGTTTGVAAVVNELTERRQAEQQIRERDEQLRLAHEATSLGTWRYDVATRTLHVDARAREHFGLEADSIGQESLLARLSPEDQDRLRQEMSSGHMLKEDGYATEIRVIAPTGPPRWLALQARVYYDEASSDSRRPLLAIGASQDITARKRDEADLRAAHAQAQASARALAEHAALLNTLINNAPIGIAFLDFQLRYRHINAEMAAMNLLSSEEHLGRTVGEVQPALAPQIEARCRQVMATGEPILNQEIRGERPSDGGGPRTWLASYYSVRAADGLLLGVGVITREITANLLAARIIDQERRQLAAIVETLTEGVVAIHPDGEIALMNDAFRRLGALDAVAPQVSGAGAATAVAVRAAEGGALSGQDWPGARVLRGERLLNVELLLERAHEPEGRWLTYSGTPVYDDRGELVLGVVTAHEITQQKQAEATLRAHAETLSRTNAELAGALRLKDEFLAMMSHELRTPLNAVLGVSEAMAEGMYGPVSERQLQALATVEQSGRHLLAILSDILDLVRIEAGAEQVDLGPVDIESVGRAALQVVQPAARQKGVHLRRIVDPMVERIRADERRLTQILVHLLDNAVKFTPAGGTVGLECTADPSEEHVQITVWDTGIGIAEEDLGRLFQPFTQVDGGLARQYGGIGLGLTLVRRLVELHGGSIGLTSAPGQGSRFTVRLPWRATEPTPTWAHEPPAPPWSRPPRVVVADDHEVTLALYGELLADHGMEVATARTGAEAVAQVRATRPDVVVLDIQMPEMDGLTAIRHIRAEEGGQAVPIIAVTALTMPGDRERCLAAGASHYLAKPMGLHTLVELITSLLPTRMGGGAPTHTNPS